MTRLATQRLSVGPLKEAFEARREALREEDFAERLLAADATLWPNPKVSESRLGWLRLARQMRSEVAGWQQLAGEVAAVGVRNIVVLGMGGSSLAPEVFGALLAADAERRLVVLDSTHPVSVDAYLQAFPPSASLYVIASKSGTTLETLSFWRTFWHAAKGDGGRFIAITDPGTPLAELAREHDFRRLLLAPPDVGGRFSALSQFGLVPATLAGIDPEPLLAGGEAALAAVGEALELGVLLGEAALAGRDKVTFLPDPELEPFVCWLEQLLAESTGKRGHGLVPVCGEPDGAHHGSDRLFVRLSLGERQSDLPPDLAASLETLSAAGQPWLELSWPNTEVVGGEMVRWQLATATAAAVLGVQPFDQPDVDLAKRLARDAMQPEGSAPENDPPSVSATDGAALQQAIELWLEGAAAGDYIALQAFLPAAEEVLATIEALRTNLAATGLPTTVGFGPRYLHSTGQLHKGGRQGVFCLQLIDRGEPGPKVPGMDYDYRTLIDGQALGEARALAQRGRRVLRVVLGD